MNRVYKKITGLGLAAYLSVCSGCIGVNNDGSLYVDNKEIAQEKENWKKTKEEIKEDIDERNKEGAINLRGFGHGFKNEWGRLENFVNSLGKLIAGNPEQNKEDL